MIYSTLNYLAEVAEPFTPPAPTDWRISVAYILTGGIVLMFRIWVTRPGQGQK